MFSLQLLMSLIAGAAAGVVFFTTLWYTTRALPRSNHPALLAMGSLVARMTVAGGVFLLIARSGHWEPIAAAMIGFVAVRVFAVHRVRHPSEAN
jgi:F1F0 ATPase subunit 2